MPPDVDRFGNPIEEQAVDRFGNTIEEQAVDRFGNPIIGQQERETTPITFELPVVPNYDITPTSVPDPVEPEGFWGSIGPGFQEEIDRQLYGSAFVLPEDWEQERRAYLREEETAPVERSFLGQVGAGAGSTLPYIGLGLASLAAAPVSVPLAGAISLGALAMGIASGAGDAAQRAETAGATEEEISKAAGWGMLPGATEFFSPIRLIRRFSKAFGPAADEVAEELSGTVMQKLGRKLDGTSRGRIAQATVEEAIQEAFAETAQNLIARQIYNPEQELLQGTGESTAVGGSVGALIATLGELVGLILPGRPRGRGAPEVTTETGQTMEMFPETMESPLIDQPLQDSSSLRLNNLGYSWNPQKNQWEKTTTGTAAEQTVAQATGQETVVDTETTPTETITTPSFEEMENLQLQLPTSEQAIDEIASAPTLRTPDDAQITIEEAIDADITAEIESMYDAEETVEIERMLAEDAARDASIENQIQEAEAQEADAELTSSLEEVDSRVRAARIEETTRKREDILTPLLLDENITNVEGAFQAALNREGFTDTAITPNEQVLINRIAAQKADTSRSTAELEALIPDANRQPTTPTRETVSVPEANRLNRERLDRTGRLPRNVDPNEASGVQLEIPTINREPEADPPTPLTPPQQDFGTALKQLNLPFGTGSGAGSRRTVSPDDFRTQDARDKAARPSAPISPTPDQTVVVDDAEAIETVRRAAVAPPKDKYKPNGAIQFYAQAFGDEIPTMLRSIAYDTSTPVTGDATKGFKKEKGYVKDNKRGNAATTWVRENLSDARAAELETYIREAQNQEVRSRMFLERYNENQLSQRLVDNYLKDGSRQPDELTREAVAKNKAPREYLIKDAVSASMAIASKEVNDLALDGDTVGTLKRVAENSFNRRVKLTATVLSKFIGNTKIEFAENLVDVKGRPAAAAYNRSTDTIELDLNTPLTVHALLHEAAHAATLKILNNPSHPATKKLTQLYENLKKDAWLANSNPYAMESLADFVAEAFTNIDFQVQLSSFTPTGGRQSAWTRFRNAVANWLKIPTSNADKQTTDYINTILATNPTTRNATDVTNNLQEGNLEMAGLAAVSGGVALGKADTLEQSLESVKRSFATYTQNARAKLLNGVGLEAIADAIKDRIPSVVGFHRIFNLIDGVRTNEGKRLTTIANSIKKAFRAKKKGVKNSLRVLDNLVSVTTIEGVDPRLSDKEKRQRYSQYRVTYGAVERQGTPKEKLERKTEYFDTKIEADSLKARLEAEREATKRTGKPTIKGPIRLTEPNADTQNALAEAEALYNQLTKDQQLAYSKILDEYKRLDDKMIEAESANIDMLDADSNVKGAVREFMFLRRLTSGDIDPYAPLFREGEFWIEYVFTDPTGQVDYGTAGFKSEGERTVAMEKLQEQGVDVERRTYEDVLKTVRGLEGGMSVPFLIELKKEVDAILETIDDAPTKQSLQTFLEESIIRGLPHQSIVQARRTRRGIKGYETNALYVFEKRMPQLIASYANLKYQTALDIEAAKIREQRNKLDPDDPTNEYYREAVATLIGRPADPNAPVLGLPTYVQFVKNPHLPEWSKIARSGSFMWTLGGNVSSVVVNMHILPFVVEAKLAAMYGPAKGTINLLQALGMYMGTVGTTTVETIRGPEEQFGALSFSNTKNWVQGRRYELLAPLTKLQQLMGFDTRTLGSETSDIEAPSAALLNKANYYMGLVFSHSERLTRQVTSAAFYISEMEKLTGKAYRKITDAELETYGVEAAETAIEQTLWANSSAVGTTAARITFDKYGVGSTAWQYRRVPAQMVYQQLSMANAIKITMLNQAKNDTEREEAKMLFRTFVYLTAIGSAYIGAQGIPGYGLVAAIANFFFLDEDEDDFNTMMAKEMGAGYYGWLATGTLFGYGDFWSPKIDLTQRINLTNLLIRDPGNYRTDASFTERAAGAALGAWGSITARGIENGRRLWDDDPTNNARAMEGIAPAWMANIIRADRVREEGYRTRRGGTGDKIVGPDELTDAQLTLQALGFMPFEYSYKRNQLALNIRKQRGMEARRAVLVNSFILSLGSPLTPANPDLHRETVEKIAKFNEEHPVNQITTDSLLASINARGRGDASALLTNGFATNMKDAIRIAKENREMDEAIGLGTND